MHPLRRQFALATLLAVTACGGGTPTAPPPPPPVASALVLPEAVTLAPGQMMPLSATPRDAGDNPVYLMDHKGLELARGEVRVAAAVIDRADPQILPGLEILRHGG